MLAQISELDCDLSAYLIIGRRRDADTTRFGYTLKPCCNIHAVTENVIALDQDVAEVDPDPVQHTPVLWDALVAFGHHRLHRNRALDRIDHRGKLKQHAVSGSLDETPAMLCHRRIGDGAVFAESARCTDLVEAHEPRVTGYISRDDGR
jgi:hypothetical protein